MINKKIFTIIAITLILIIGFFIGLYIIGIRSEPYFVALKFIDSNKTVFEEVGTLKSRRLAFFGYSVRYNGPQGYAEYRVIVKGDQDEGEVYLELEKTTGVWKVVSANLKLDNKRTVNLFE